MAGPEGSMRVETEGGFDRKTCSVAAAIRRMTSRLRGSRRPVGSESNDYLPLGDRFSVASGPRVAADESGSARTQLGVQRADQAGHPEASKNSRLSASSPAKALPRRAQVDRLLHLLEREAAAVLLEQVVDLLAQIAQQRGDAFDVALAAQRLAVPPAARASDRARRDGRSVRDPFCSDSRRRRTAPDGRPGRRRPGCARAGSQATTSPPVLPRPRCLSSTTRPAEVDAQPAGLEGHGRRLDHDAAQTRSPHARSAPATPRQRREPGGVDRRAFGIDAGLRRAARGHPRCRPSRAKVRRDEATHVRGHARLDHAARLTRARPPGARPRQPVALDCRRRGRCASACSRPSARGFSVRRGGSGRCRRRHSTADSEVVDHQHLALADHDRGVAVGEVIGRVEGGGSCRCRGRAREPGARAC